MTASKPTANIPGTFQLIAETLTLYRIHFRWYLGYAAWALIPLIFVLLFSLTLPEEIFEILELFIFSFLEPALLLLIAILCFLLTGLFLEKRKPHSGVLGKQAMALLIPYLMLSLILCVLELLGSLLLIIPGMIIATWFAFAKPILIFEQAPILTALKKSKDLICIRFFPVFFRLIAASLLFLLFFLLGYLGIAFASFGLSGMDMETFLQSSPSLAEQILSQVFLVFLLPLPAIYLTTFYHHLKKISL
ncbi:MAG: hypothetical protein WC730_03520 [Patescibacteria group bacterium]|jgi:hypothetical protein